MWILFLLVTSVKKITRKVNAINKSAYLTERVVFWYTSTGINKLTQRVPLWVVGALTGAVMLSIYLGFNMMLHGLEKPVIEKFETISQMSSVLEKK